MKLIPSIIKQLALRALFLNGLKVYANYAAYVLVQEPSIIYSPLRDCLNTFSVMNRLLL